MHSPLSSQFVCLHLLLALSSLPTHHPTSHCRYWFPRDGWLVRIASSPSPLFPNCVYPKQQQHPGPSLSLAPTRLVFSSLPRYLPPSSLVFITALVCLFGLVFVFFITVVFSVYLLPFLPYPVFFQRFPPPLPPKSLGLYHSQIPPPSVFLPFAFTLRFSRFSCLRLPALSLSDLSDILSIRALTSPCTKSLSPSQFRS